MNVEMQVSGVCERDVDLLLLEELASSPDFLRWFTARAAGIPAGQALAVRRSVTQTNGESDLELCYLDTDGKKGLLLVENKVAASFQTDQAQRYQERVKNYLSTGEYGVCSAVLIAPEDYLASNPEDMGFDCCLTYEEIADWYNCGDDPRRHYKIYLLRAAIEKSHRGYNPVEDELVSSFWLNYWELANGTAPELELPRPSGKPSGSSFVPFRPSGFPKGIRIVHKLAMGFVDLEISGAGRALFRLKQILEPHLEPEMEIVRTYKSAVVRIAVDSINIPTGFEIQKSQVAEGLGVARILFEWVKNNPEALKQALEALAEDKKS